MLGDRLNIWGIAWSYLTDILSSTFTYHPSTDLVSSLGSVGAAETFSCAISDRAVSESFSAAITVGDKPPLPNLTRDPCMIGVKFTQLVISTNLHFYLVFELTSVSLARLDDVEKFRYVCEV